jgi:hypothetical protein
VSLALQIDPETRDIFIGAHDAVFVEDPTTELLLAIGVRRGSLWQDPDQGSDIRPSCRTGTRRSMRAMRSRARP